MARQHTTFTGTFGTFISDGFLSRCRVALGYVDTFFIIIVVTTHPSFSAMASILLPSRSETGPMFLCRISHDLPAKKTKTVIRQLLRLYTEEGCTMHVVANCMKCMAAMLTGYRTNSTLRNNGRVDSVLKLCPYLIPKVPSATVCLPAVPCVDGSLLFVPLYDQLDELMALPWSLYARPHEACSSEDEDHFLVTFCFITVGSNWLDDLWQHFYTQ